MATLRIGAEASAIGKVVWGLMVAMIGVSGLPKLAENELKDLVCCSNVICITHLPFSFFLVFFKKVQKSMGPDKPGPTRLFSARLVLAKKIVGSSANVFGISITLLVSPAY
jgi:predicted metallo-beta-lactamase superfamily hydrolase